MDKIASLQASPLFNQRRSEAVCLFGLTSRPINDIVASAFSCRAADISRWQNGMEVGLSGSVLSKIDETHTAYDAAVEEEPVEEKIHREKSKQKMLESLSNPINIDHSTTIKIYEEPVTPRENKRDQLRKTLHHVSDTTHVE